MSYKAMQKSSLHNLHANRVRGENSAVYMIRFENSESTLTNLSILAKTYLNSLNRSANQNKAF